MNLEDNKARFSLSNEELMDLNTLRGSTSLQDAMQLLDDDEGRNISAGAQNMPQNAQFGFLLLRHIKIRDRRIKVSTAFGIGEQMVFFSF